MKKAIVIFKSQLKYMTIIIALILFISQVYLNIVETTQKNNSKEITYLAEENKCNKSDYSTGILIAIFKCSLAFLAGGLISDMKFIKFGVI
jgi:hypothetical protein